MSQGGGSRPRYALLGAFAFADLADGSYFFPTGKELKMGPAYDIRCSLMVVRNHNVLLIHRTHDSLDDWVLPGGTPHEGETLTGCARRELLEETGISANPSGVAFVVESQLPGSPRVLLDIVFIANEPLLGREHCREPGLVPCFVSPDQIPELQVHPNFAAQLIHLTDPVPHQYAAYLRNFVGPLDETGLTRVVVADTRRPPTT